MRAYFQEAQHFANRERIQSMPDFGDRLSDQQIADLVNYLRVAYGGLAEDIGAEQVKVLREH
ncbi:MAG: cytochrome c [Rouxiella aceris]|uniref:c-type cytochrome n=1 Tax=Rouxiella aceris TaxID=2703884 RepID=UPI002846C3E1|nr:cytochrome c [Rouxiella aceris]MDR3434099.1 cytochrome c [Rouxiella aceris]